MLVPMVLLALAAAPTTTPTATATTTPNARVVLSGTSRPDILQQLRGELTALGFTVEQAPPGAALTWRALRQKARDDRAVAALQIEQEAGELELWVSDLATGKVLIRALPADKGLSARLVALRAVELLRVSLQEVGMPSAREVAEAPPPPAPVLEAIAPPQPPPPVLSAAFGVLGAWSPGGLGPSAAVELEARWRLGDRLALLVDLGVPLVPSELGAPEGKASIRWWTAAVGVRLALLTGRALEPGLSLRLGGVAADMVGTGNAPYVGQVDQAFAARAALGVDARWVLSRHFALRPELGVAFALPEVSVRFGGRRAGGYGTPELSLGLVGEVAIGE
ncbi:MAG: hypothetical protein QM765_30855 [Myxococcales bacterium]